MTHLDEKEVERFLGGDLSPEEQRKVVRHFLTDCRSCRAKLVSFSEVLFRAEELKEDARGVQSFSYDTALAKPDVALMDAHRAQFAQWKAQRSQGAVDKALDTLASAAQSSGAHRDNVFARVVEAAQAGCTHGEICATRATGHEQILRAGERAKSALYVGTDFIGNAGRTERLLAY